MNANLYAMECDVRQRLAEARTEALGHHIAAERAGRRRGLLRAVVDRARVAYVRWSSAASAGSNPRTVRAWSRSR